LSERIDTDALLRTVNIVDIIGRRISLKKKGVEYYGVCPFHDDDKASLQVNEKKQVYKCFACSAGGDAIDYLQRLGMTFHQAIAEINGDVADIKANPEKRIGKAKREEVEDWKQIPPQAPPREIAHFRHGKPAVIYQYRDTAGKLIGYTCRFHLEDGTKQVLPFTYCSNSKGKSEWRWHGFAAPRPLYGLEAIKKYPDKTVVIVEGEKTKDAGSRLLLNAVVVTWIGGAQAIKETDWSPLHGRKIILWPDNDKEQRYGEKHEQAGQVKPFYEQPGNSAMLIIEGLLRDHCPVIKWVRNIDELPNKWDIADAEDWTSDTAREYVIKNLYVRGAAPEMKPVETITKDSPKTPEPPKSKGEPPEPVQQDPPVPPPVKKQDPAQGHKMPFRFLGFDKSPSGGQQFHFFAEKSGTIFSYSSSALSKTALMTLAPLQDWEMMFMDKRGLDMDQAQNWIIQHGTNTGIFDERRIRGRGAWVEGKDIILHGGDKLIVNGKTLHLTGFKSRNIYEAGHELGFNTERPLSVRESSEFMDLCKMISWERNISAYLFAGWCVLAPICGALDWRPHIWITGGAGTGKTWLMRQILRKTLGESALSVQSETTEAGIRQILGHDALPVAFDEAEGNERRDTERIQTVLNLMRAASSEDGGIMAKGSAGGTAKTYRIRSCFAFASISVGVYLHSDRSRVSVLALTTEPERTLKEEKWKILKAKHREIISDDYCSRMRARTIHRLVTIRANAETFAEAVAYELGEQRAGDQLGTLLAGAYSLVSDGVISYEEACKWVKERDWTEEKNNEASKDELALFSFLMEQMVRMESQLGTVERTIGELVHYAANYSLGHDEYTSNPDKAQDRLKRFGFKVEGDYLIVSNTSDQIRKSLAGTQWSKNHNKILQRIIGAVSVNSIRFGSGVPTRGVKIPLHFVIKEK
jgi:putative DNA primase/helicase